MNTSPTSHEAEFSSSSFLNKDKFQRLFFSNLLDIEQENGKQQKEMDHTNSLHLFSDVPFYLIDNSQSFSELDKGLKMIFNKLIRNKDIFDANNISPVCRMAQILSMMFASKLSILLQQSLLFEKDLNDAKMIHNEYLKLMECWDNQLLVLQNTFPVSSPALTGTLNMYKQASYQVTKALASQNLKLIRERENEIITVRTSHAQLLDAISVSNIINHDTNDTTSNAQIIQSILKDAKDILVLFKGKTRKNDDGNDISTHYDVSSEGIIAWKAMVKSYDDKIMVYEFQIAKILISNMENVKNDRIILSLCLQYSPLLNRPLIKKELHAQWIQALECIKNDIMLLNEKYKESFQQTHFYKVCQIRDIPPFSALILWTIQIERSLNECLLNLRALIGSEIQTLPELKKAKDIGETLRRKLNITNMVNEFFSDLSESSNITVFGRIFTVLTDANDSNQDCHNQKFDICVNFDWKILNIYKEVNNLESMGFTVPFKVKSLSQRVEEKYPLVISIQNSLKLYRKCMEISTKHTLNSLTFSRVHHIRDFLSRTFRRDKSCVTWESKKLNEFAQEFSNSVNALHQEVSAIEKATFDINKLVDTIKTCRYDSASFAKIFMQIQGILDELQAVAVSSIQEWFKPIQAKIYEDLGERMGNQVSSWVNDYINKGNQMENIQYVNEKIGWAIRTRGLYSITMSIEQALLKMTPSLDIGRSYWIKTFHQCVIKPIQDLPQLRCNRVYDSAGDSHLSHIERRIAKKRIHHESDMVTRSLIFSQGINIAKFYQEVEFDVSKVIALGESFNELEFLWDQTKSYPTFDVVNIMGSSNSIEEFGSMLKTFAKKVENFESYYLIGKLFVVNCSNLVQSLKEMFKIWRENTFQQLAQASQSICDEVFAALSTSTKELRKITDDTLDFFVLFHNVLQNKIDFEGKLKSVILIESILSQNGFNFPINWVWSSKVQEEFVLYNNLIQRNLSRFESNMSGIHTKIETEVLQHVTSIKFFNENWIVLKQSFQAENPRMALKTIRKLEIELDSLITNEKRILDLSFALSTLQSTKSSWKSIEITGLDSIGSKLLLESLQKELHGLKDVWTNLHDVSSSVTSLYESRWHDVRAEDIFKTLEKSLDYLVRLPLRIQQYEAYHKMRQRIRSLVDTQPIIVDLKSEAIKERHLMQLIQFLEIRMEAAQLHTQKKISNASDILLGDLWNFGLGFDDEVKKFTRSIVSVAQGEYGLEYYLKQVESYWMNAKFDLVSQPMRASLKLIRGWEELFLQIDEHSSGLASMKQSPYFKYFDKEVKHWEDTLTKIRILLDKWVEVQKQWVHFSGIFYKQSSSNISTIPKLNTQLVQQLPEEFQRFKACDNNLVTLMHHIAVANAKKSICDILTDTTVSVAKVVNPCLGEFELIQRGLGKYLETQRSLFPRFYFIGDDDLLEILGNSNPTSSDNESNNTKDPEILQISMVKQTAHLLQRHLSKMFAGISSLLVGENGNIVGMQSSEGECVYFKPEGVNICSTSDNNNNDIQIDPSNIWLSKIESTMKLTLKYYLGRAIDEFQSNSCDSKMESFASFVCDSQFPLQIIILTIQVWWTRAIEEYIMMNESKEISNLVLGCIETRLEEIASVVGDYRLDMDARTKYEHIIREYVRLRDCTRQLKGLKAKEDYSWLSQLRFYWIEQEQKLKISLADSTFDYGFEYQGIGERLVHTPLTSQCYLTLTQALHHRLGGNPFGPAGTGKTETVKSLGTQLGRFVIVFNCDEKFDLKSMSRIFVGLCEVGAWGCFDEFNRLEERTLSALSQQILTIQQGLSRSSSDIDLIDQGSSSEGNSINKKKVHLHPDVGLFITMNPGYIGRSKLPENLKHLFRSVAMMNPDWDMIAQVMLVSQGFSNAELLARKICLVFDLCRTQLSSQPHYDFGLRAIKAVLQSAGNKRRTNSCENDELLILLQSILEMIEPRLVLEDIETFERIIQSVFPGVVSRNDDLSSLYDIIKKTCTENHLSIQSKDWTDKIIQLYQTQLLRHGLMLVGCPGSGKSSAWKMLLKSMEKYDGVKGESYIIDPKAISKDDLFGVLDPVTLDWKDGIFTKILRQILENTRGESMKRHWIVFDGDVDPQWAENLNSVLDDNKVFTLPNGTRLSIPSNVRIVFEVDSLEFATPATISRCGMIYFSEHTLPLGIVCEKEFSKILNQYNSDESSVWKQVIENVMKPLIGKYLQGDDNTLLSQVFQQSVNNHEHVMTVQRDGILTSFFSIFELGVNNLYMQLNHQSRDVEAMVSLSNKYLSKWIILSLVWGFGGSMPPSHRKEYCNKLVSLMKLNKMENLLPNELLQNLNPVHDGRGSNDGINDLLTLLDFEVDISSGNWKTWSNRFGKDEEMSPVTPNSDGEQLIRTEDTEKHGVIIDSWIKNHKPLILCGPPGSGKTMTLTNFLQSNPDYTLASLNFSSATSPDIILKVFDLYCEYKNSSEGVVLQPKESDKWLIIFCDEINLPEKDTYGSQKVICFLRQLIEQNGFWSNPMSSSSDSDSSWKGWVNLQRIQFVGACNPPTDPGRVPLGNRFLRQCCLLYIDHPETRSLFRIYKTFIHRTLESFPSVEKHASILTEAMVAIYFANKTHFDASSQPHYVYSSRELSRWVRAVNEGLRLASSFSNDTSNDESFIDYQYLVKLWLHEGLRLFHDRLVEKSEQIWCINEFKRVLQSVFRLGQDEIKHLISDNSTVLFSSWLAMGQYVPVSRQAMRLFLEDKVKRFREEIFDVPIVIFDEVVDHVLRIDRVLKQPMGHMLLCGQSGCGKTLLTRFVAWLNDMKTFQIKMSRAYGLEDFESDLREVIKLAGCKGSKVCFIFDESNALPSSFLEMMNALLVSGEVPGLFEGEEKDSLIQSFQEENSVPDLAEGEVMKMLRKRVQNNLHIVFTMNPASSDLRNRARTSPALFNRCVVDWFGDWSDEALKMVAQEYLRSIDIRSSDEIVRSIVQMHKSVKSNVQKGSNKIKGSMSSIPTSLSNSSCAYVSPRDFIDFVKRFVQIFREKSEEADNQHKHITVGLDKLSNTRVKIEEMSADLSKKEKYLVQKHEKLNKMIHESTQKQKVCEKRKVEVEDMEIQLQKQNEIVQIRKEEVESKLKVAMSQLEEAKKDVDNIDRKKFSEIKSLKEPPPSIKVTLQAVVEMISEDASDSWENIRKAVLNKSFFGDVLDFDPNNIPKKRQERVRKLIHDHGLTRDIIKRANDSCYVLFNWIESQLTCSEILLIIGPLNLEIEKLTKESDRLSETLFHKKNERSILEKDIAEYEKEVTNLRNEIDSIKSEMDIVDRKIKRAQMLFSRLENEFNEWTKSQMTFGDKISSLPGDSLLSSAFCAYCGPHDFGMRSNLMEAWKGILNDKAADIKYSFSPSFDIILNFLSRESEKFEYGKNKLPLDDRVCVENAVILDRSDRFPLIVDPSGIALDYITSRYEKSGMVKTSFLDPGFLKKLESSLRFGTKLLIQDAENIDPILNPVLNRETIRIGGRVVIRLGGQYIDYSPHFSMILITKDSYFSFPPDICSRVTLINFGITQWSLEGRILGSVLLSENPDIERKRREGFELVGTYKARLHEIEESLLEIVAPKDALDGKERDSTKTILDDDETLTKLEQLKNETATITDHLAKLNQLVIEIDDYSNNYLPFTRACSKVYFLLQSLSPLHQLYRYSIQEFFDVVQNVLIGTTFASLSGKSKKGKRSSNVFEKNKLHSLLQGLFIESYQRYSTSMLPNDQAVLLLSLAAIKNELTMTFKFGHGKECDPTLNIVFMKSLSDFLVVSKSKSDISNIAKLAGSKEVSSILSELQLHQLSALIDILEPHMASSQMKKIVDVVSKVAKSKEDIDLIHKLVYPEEIDELNAFLIKLSILKIARAEAMYPLITSSIVNLLQIEGESKSEEIVVSSGSDTFISALDSDGVAKAPFLLVVSPGLDVVSLVEATALNSEPAKTVTSYALGSQEILQEINENFDHHVRNGHWLFLKNIHFAPSEWLLNLEKRFSILVNESSKDKQHQQQQISTTFRLILSCEVDQSGRMEYSNIPKTLIQNSRKIMLQQESGVKESVNHLIDTNMEERMEIPSKLAPYRNRLYLLLAWVHTVVIQRLKYHPIGWTKRYEFGDSDLAAAMDVIDSWLELTISNGNKISSSKDIPWQAIIDILVNCVYGGKVDNVYDMRALHSIMSQVFNDETFDSGRLLNPLYADSSDVSSTPVLPDVKFTTERSNILKWIRDDLWKLNESPKWLGLADSLDKHLFETRSLSIISKWVHLQRKGMSNDLQRLRANKADQEQIASWMKIIIDAQRSALDAKLSLQSVKENIIQQALKREVNTAVSLCNTILEDLESVASHQQLQKVDLDTLDTILYLESDVVPLSWRRKSLIGESVLNLQYRVSEWIHQAFMMVQSIANDVKQLDITSLANIQISISNLFYPFSLITATRQYYSELYSWPIESLHLFIKSGSKQNAKLDKQKVGGCIKAGKEIFINGGSYELLSGSLAFDEQYRIHDCVLEWNIFDSVNNHSKDNRMNYSIPVFLNVNRKNKVYDVYARISLQEKDSWDQQNVAIILSDMFEQENYDQHQKF